MTSDGILGSCVSGSKGVLRQCTSKVLPDSRMDVESDAGNVEKEIKVIICLLIRSTLFL